MATSQEYTISRKVSDTEEEIIQIPYGSLANKPDLSVYQTKNDASLKTNDKTVVGAINEVVTGVAETLESFGMSLAPQENGKLNKKVYVYPDGYLSQGTSYDASKDLYLSIGDGLTLETIDETNNIWNIKSASAITSVDGLGGGAISGDVSTSGNLTVGCNLTVNGTTTIVDSTTLQVKDKLIEVAHGNTTALTTPAGLVAPKYDGTSSGALVFDSTGTAYVGDVKLDSAGNIDVSKSELQPLATRTGLVGGNLVQYDSTAQTLKDSGKKISDLALKTDVSGKLSKTENTGVNVLGTTKSTTTLGGNQLVAPNGIILAGTAANAGLVTRGICGVSTPDSKGACSKENLYINYDGNNDFNAGRQVVLNADAVGNHLGSNMYQYAVPRGDIVKAWVEAQGYAKTTQIPTVNNGTLTIQQNGTNVATFGANQSTNATANITTITDVKMNSTSKVTNGVADLGTVLTDASKFATSAQGTKADNAMPKAGGAFTGAVTVQSPTAEMNPATKQYVDTAINAVKQFEYQVVTELPTAAQATMGKIYLVAHSHNPSDGKPDSYDEFITVQSGSTYKWERIGNTDIDLSGYVPTTRKINSKALSSDITLYPTDVGVNETTFPGLKKTGTVTAVKINGATKNPASGVVDIGTVLTDASKFATAAQGTKADNAMPKSGGTFTGNVSLPKELIFTDNTNPFIKMTTGGTDFYFQSTSGQFGLGPTWNKATHWDSNGNVTFPTTPKVGSSSLALKSDIPPKVTDSTVSGWGFTKNEGTVTSVSVKMNGESKGTVTNSGTIDLGTVITDISGKLDKTTYEVNKTIEFGRDGALYVGKFKVYDTNVTCEVTSTTNVTYSGKLVIATQNYVIKQMTVYGDAANTVAPNFFIKPSTTSDPYIEVYFKPASWSKNVVHIYGSEIKAEPTNVCTNVPSVPSTATLKPKNALPIFELSGTTLTITL